MTTELQRACSSKDGTRVVWLGLSLLLAIWFGSVPRIVPAADAPVPPAVAVPNAEAKSEKEMKAYVEPINGSDVKFEMVPIPGGE